MAQDYEIKVKVTGVDQAKTQVDGLTESMDEAGDSGSNAFGALNGMLGGLPAKFGGAIKGIRGMVVGMKTLRGAIIATGIGALVVVVGSLIAYFDRTEKGSQELRVAMATLGGVTAALMDNVIHLGEFLVKAFKDPQGAMKEFADMVKSYVVDQFTKILEGAGMLGDALVLLFQGEFSQAADVAAEGLSSIADGAMHLTAIPAAIIIDQIVEQGPGIAATAKAAAELERRMNALMVQEREHLKVRAQTNKIIAENRLLVEDETMSYDDRIAALDKAIAAELNAVDQELKMASERAEILRKQAALAESDEATKQAVAEAEAKVIEIETQSLKQRKRLEGERQSLIKQRTSETEAAAAAIIKAEQEVQKALKEAALSREDAQTQEIEKEKAKYQALQEKAGENMELLAQLKEAERLALLDIDAKYDALELAAEQKKEDEAKKIRDAADAQRQKDTEAAEQAMAELKESATAGTFSLLTTLNKAFAKDTEEGQKKAFKRNQALNIAETLISTYAAAQKAYASQLAIPTPDAPIRAQIAAGVAVAAGLAKVAAIKSQQFTGGGSAGGATGGGAGGLGGGVQSVGVDVGTLIPNQQTPTPEPVRAYVVENEISNKQALNRELQIQTTL
jgi:hypothetical protein